MGTVDPGAGSGSGSGRDQEQLQRASGSVGTEESGVRRPGLGC